MRTFLLLTLFNFTICAQQKLKDFFYNENYYDIFIFTELEALNINLIENPKQLNHAEFLEYLKSTLNTNTFFISSGIVNKDNCEFVGLVNLNNTILSKINQQNGNGNFYLKPNGGITITNNSFSIFETSSYVSQNNTKLAFQTGVMLINDFKINSNFNYYSTNKLIRNAVGISTNKFGVKSIIFAISKNSVSLFDFSEMFLQCFNTSQALLLQSSNCIMHFSDESVNSNQTFCNYLVFNKI